MTDNIIRLVRAARGSEAGGYNNVAKLLWALAYAEEVKQSNTAGVPRGADLEADLSSIMDDLRGQGANKAVMSALEKGLLAIREDGPVPYDDIPAVHVSRTEGEVFVGDPPEFSRGHDHWLGMREFRPIWYLDPLSPVEVLAALENNPPIIDAQLAGLTEQQLLVAPAAGEWNMHQLLWHLMMAQELLTERIDLLLTENNPSLEARAVWAQKDQQGMSTGEVLEHYHDLRDDLVLRLKGISAEDWWRSGWHSEFGEQTVLSQATYFARHEMSHMPQFSQIRREVEG